MTVRPRKEAGILLQEARRREAARRREKEAPPEGWRQGRGCPPGRKDFRPALGRPGSPGRSRNLRPAAREVLRGAESPRQEVPQEAYWQPGGRPAKRERGLRAPRRWPGPSRFRPPRLRLRRYRRMDRQAPPAARGLPVPRGWRRGSVARWEAVPGDRREVMTSAMRPGRHHRPDPICPSPPGTGSFPQSSRPARTRLPTVPRTCLDSTAFPFRWPGTKGKRKTRKGDASLDGDRCRDSSGNPPVRTTGWWDSRA